MTFLFLFFLRKVNNTRKRFSEGTTIYPYNGENVKTQSAPNIEEIEETQLHESSVQFSSVYCFAITECTNANYYYLNTNGEEAQGKPSG